MHLAVKRLRRERQQILMMQLVGHARERRAEVVGAAQLEVAAAGPIGQRAEVGIRAGSLAAG